MRGEKYQVRSAKYGAHPCPSLPHFVLRTPYSLPPTAPSRWALKCPAHKELPGAGHRHRSDLVNRPAGDEHGSGLGPQAGTAALGAGHLAAEGLEPLPLRLVGRGGVFLFQQPQDADEPVRCRAAVDCRVSAKAVPAACPSGCRPWRETVEGSFGVFARQRPFRLSTARWPRRPARGRRRAAPSPGRTPPVPRAPRTAGHAPYGLLKLNVRGSNSS